MNATNRIPVSVRITQEDADFIAELKIEGANTPSEKIRELLKQAGVPEGTVITLFTRNGGGPTFIEDETTVVAVTSFGVNSTCAGTSGVYRIDTQDDLAWLGQFVS